MGYSRLTMWQWFQGNSKGTQSYIYMYPFSLLEKAMAPHSSTFAWKIHGRRSLVGCSPWGREESDTTERLPFPFSLSCIGDGNGNPLQCSCLETPRDGEPGGLPSMGSHRVRHDWSNLAAAAFSQLLCLLDWGFEWWKKEWAKQAREVGEVRPMEYSCCLLAPGLSELVM